MPWAGLLPQPPPVAGWGRHGPGDRGGGLGLGAAEEPAQEAAALALVLGLWPCGQLLLQLGDPGLEVGQPLLLHQDHLGHQVGGHRLTGDQPLDQGLGLDVPGAGLGLGLGQALEQALDHVAFLVVHRLLPLCWGGSGRPDGATGNSVGAGITQ